MKYLCSKCWRDPCVCPKPRVIFPAFPVPMTDEERADFRKRIMARYARVLAYLAR